MTMLLYDRYHVRENIFKGLRYFNTLLMLTASSQQREKYKANFVDANNNIFYSKFRLHPEIHFVDDTGALIMEEEAKHPFEEIPKLCI